MVATTVAEDEEARATLLAIDEDEIEAESGKFEEERGGSMFSLYSLLAGDEAMLADT